MALGTATRGLVSIRWEPSGGGQEQFIDIDCTPSERYTSAAEVTEAAVEKGANIADHVRAKNETLTLECYISGTPIDSPIFGTDGATGSFQPLSIEVDGKRVNASVWTFSQPFQRVAACDRQFRAHTKGGQRLTVWTGVRRMTDVVITSYAWSRTAPTGRDLSLTLELSQIRVASTQRVPVTAARRRVVHATTDRGGQPTTPAVNASLADRVAFGGQ